MVSWGWEQGIWGEGNWGKRVALPSSEPTMKPKAGLPTGFPEGPPGLAPKTLVLGELEYPGWQMPEPTPSCLKEAALLKAG